ncbi:MAG: hypothetical protein AAF495_13225 [Pseudomonadota bacterium]
MDQQLVRKLFYIKALSEIFLDNHLIGPGGGLDVGAISVEILGTKNHGRPG